MKVSRSLEIAAALLILLFAYTGFSKAAGITQVVIMLRQSFGRLLYDEIWAYMLVASELLAVVLLLLPVTRGAGFLLSFFLMTVFLLYTAYGWVRPWDMPCSCGGVISSLSWSGHTVFNSIFWLIAFYGSVRSLLGITRRFNVLLQ